MTTISKSERALLEVIREKGQADAAFYETTPNTKPGFGYDLSRLRKRGLIEYVPPVKRLNNHYQITKRD